MHLNKGSEMVIRIIFLTLFDSIQLKIMKCTLTAQPHTKPSSQRDKTGIRKIPIESSYHHYSLKLRSLSIKMEVP